MQASIRNIFLSSRRWTVPFRSVSEQDGNGLVIFSGGGTVPFGLIA